MEEYYQWDTENEEWDLIRRTDQEFDADNNLLLYQWASWDYGINDYAMGRREYVYDQNGHLQSNTYSSYDHESKD